MQSFFKSERQKHQKTYSKSQKLELLSQVENKNTKECVKVLVAASPTYAAQAQEIKIPEDAELRELLKEYRNLAMLSDGSIQAVLKSALKDAIEKKKAKLSHAKRQTLFSRYIPKKIKTAVWVRDKGKCSFINPKTQLRCGATHALQIDHILPYALGGKTQTDNLRLLCRAHNQMLALQSFGEKFVRQSL